MRQTMVIQPKLGELRVMAATRSGRLAQAQAWLSEVVIGASHAPSQVAGAAPSSVAEDVARSVRARRGGRDGVVGHGPELSAASAGGDKVARYSRRYAVAAGISFLG